MRKKVIGNDASQCFWCGRNGHGDPLDRHHIFGGANRKNSEEDGLCVMLCHTRCHLYGPEAAHQNADTAKRLKIIGQRHAMLRLGHTEESFRQRYGKNYIDESAVDIWPKEDEIC